MLKVVMLLLSLFTFSCNCEKKTVEQNKEGVMIQEFKISEIYYQSWIAGVRGGGSGIDVHITFESKLPDNIKFKKVQLLNYTSYRVDALEGFKYIARIKTETNQLVLEESPTDEYGNEAPIKVENTRKEGDVLLIFEKNGVEFTQLIQNVKQKEMLAFPSAKPRN